MREKKKSAEYEVLIVGADAHSSAICHQVVDRIVTLRLVDVPAAALLDFLKKKAQRVLAVILDDSAENALDLLAAIDDAKSKVIVLTSRREYEYAVDVMQRALWIMLRPVSFRLLDNLIWPLLRKQESDAGKIRHVPSIEHPRYCERCNFELRRLRGLEKRRGEIETLAEVERRHICDTVARCDNDVLKAAKALGIGKTTLYRKLNQYGYGRVANLTPEEYEAAHPFLQLEFLRKQAQSVIEKMKEVERRIVGRE